jgi:hypothetical protein
MARDTNHGRQINMTKLVNLSLTDSECLNLRFALNAAAMEWGDKARAARGAGEDVDAATCERIRSDYHRLWDMVNEAQEAPGRVQDWLYRREAASRAAPAICCQFHMSGGDRVLSCGGDSEAAARDEAILCGLELMGVDKHG